MSYFCVAKSESCFLGPHASTETSSMNSFIRHDHAARQGGVCDRAIGDRHRHTVLAVPNFHKHNPGHRWKLLPELTPLEDRDDPKKTILVIRVSGWLLNQLVKASMSQVGVCLLALAPAGRFSSKRCKNLRMSACIVSWLGDAASARKAAAEDEEAMFSANTGA